MQHPKLALTIPWESLEQEAQAQILRVLTLPELERLAIMPDAHAATTCASAARPCCAGPCRLRSWATTSAAACAT